MTQKTLASMLAAALLSTFSVSVAAAQTQAMSNADVARLVTLHVSQSTVIAVIQEAKAVRFDLDAPALSDLTRAEVPTAVIAAMRQRSETPASASPPALSFAGVAAAAAERRTATPKSTVVLTTADVPPGNAEAVAPSVAAVAATPKADAPAAGTALANDEAYWRGRAAPYHKRIVENGARALALERRVGELAAELYDIGPLNTRRGGVETERQRLITECQELNDAIAADLKGLEALQDEGRRAGALPGWFRK